MMMVLGYLGLIILAISFGRNSLGNIFGSAIGTGVLSARLCSILLMLAIVLGAVFGGKNVAENIQHYLHFVTLLDVAVFCLMIAGTIFIFNKLGCPVSIAQITMGGLVGWNMAQDLPVHLLDIQSLLLVWIISPLCALIISFCVFKALRYYLRIHAIPLLQRDYYIRFYMILSGCFISYMLGQNNLSVIYAPFLSVSSIPWVEIMILLAVCILLGGLLTNRHVIQTLSHDLFPLSSIESMIMLVAAGLTLALFSTNLPFLPALPISSSAALIGAIIGISIAKGGYGLNVLALRRVVLSWLWAPCLSGVICYFGMMVIMGVRP